VITSSWDHVRQPVRELRRAKGASQEELGVVLGLTKSSVSRIESGDRGLAAQEVAQLASFLGVSSDRILFGEVEEELLLRADGDPTPAVEYARRVIDDFEYLLALGV
jgi:transcriptional regulator with XRE-family HTH domain